MVLVPPLLLLPWLPAVLDRPQLTLLEAGLPGPGLSQPDLDGLDLLLLHPGGRGSPPLALLAGLGARRAGRGLAPVELVASCRRCCWAGWWRWCAWWPRWP